MAECANCGNEVPDDARICSKCGKVRLVRKDKSKDESDTKDEDGN